MAGAPRADAEPGPREEAEDASLLQRAPVFEQEAPAPGGDALPLHQGDDGEPVRSCGGGRAAVWVALAAAALAIPLALLLGLAAAGGWFRAEPRLNFFVIGDWGREGGQNQSAVAAAMVRRAAATQPPDFVISVGDNMYESGLISPEDDQFRTSFSEVYSHASLQCPWHAVLGNHDYGEHPDPDRLARCPTGDGTCFFSPLHELDERLQERDPRWHCRRSFQLSLLGGTVAIFFIDTNPFIQEYQSAPWAANRGGLLEQSWEAQLLELEADLARSPADWKLVVGHHPVLNARAPGHTPELVRHLEPVLQAQGAQAYFCGHEHDLQLLRRPGGGPSYVISGAGSRSNYSDVEWQPEASLFHHMGSGFVACSLDAAALECAFLGIAADAPLHAFRLPRSAA